MMRKIPCYVLCLLLLLSPTVSSWVPSSSFFLSRTSSSSDFQHHSKSAATRDVLVTDALDEKLDGTTISSSSTTSSSSSKANDDYIDTNYRLFSANYKPRSYPHLFRHYDDISFDSWLRCTAPDEFLDSVLLGDNTKDSSIIIDNNLSVHGKIAPHVRFAVSVWKMGTGRLAWSSTGDSNMEEQQPPEYDEECEITNDATAAPVHSLRLRHAQHVNMDMNDMLFLDCNLDRTVAPWHAYLVHQGLAAGLMTTHHNPEMRREFLNCCRTNSLDQFAALCQRWSDKTNDATIQHSVARIQAFCRSFARGLLPAVKNAQSNDLEMANCTPSEMVCLLVQHGANFLQHDKHHVSLLHWACGTTSSNGDDDDSIASVQTLLEAVTDERYHDDNDDDDAMGRVLLESTDSKDGATPLHWASVGIRRHCIGTGGSVQVCRYLLEAAGRHREALANAQTWCGHNTPILWAAWAGNLEIVQLLVNKGGANVHHVNAHGQSAAHWAAAAGHLPVCRFLARQQGVDFGQADQFGCLPLDYAAEYERNDVVQWLVDQ